MDTLANLNEYIQQEHRQVQIATLVEGITENNELTITGGTLIVAYNDNTDELCVIVDASGCPRTFFVDRNAEKLAKRLYNGGVRVPDVELQKIALNTCSPVDIIGMANDLLESEEDKPIYFQTDGDAEDLAEVIEMARFVYAGFGPNVEITNVCDVSKLGPIAKNAIVVQEWAEHTIEAMKDTSAELYAQILDAQKMRVA